MARENGGRTSGHYFAQVPWELQDTPGIRASTIAAYAALQRYADFGKTTGARVSDSTAAKEAGLSRRAFIAARMRLREMCWITWSSGSKRGSVNHYTIFRSPQPQGVQQVHTPVKNVLAPVHPQHTTESPAESRTERNKKTRVGELLDLIRSKLYIPDGEPPDGWDVRRELSVLKALKKRHTAEEIAIAIEGMALIRDFPGVYADRIDWFRQGDKLTLRPLLRAWSGRLPVYSIARNAYWKYVNARRPSLPHANVERLGSLLRRAIESQEKRSS